MKNALVRRSAFFVDQGEQAAEPHRQRRASQVCCPLGLARDPISIAGGWLALFARAGVRVLVHDVAMLAPASDHNLFLSAFQNADVNGQFCVAVVLDQFVVEKADMLLDEIVISSHGYSSWLRFIDLNGNHSHYHLLNSVLRKTMIY